LPCSRDLVLIARKPFLPSNTHTHTHTHTPFYREERAMSILKPDGEPKEEKNKALCGFLKKICVIN